MFERVRGFFMTLLSMFRTYKIEQLTGVHTNISQEMYDHIDLWARMASGNAPWNGEAKPCGVLDQIAGRLNMLIGRELGLEVPNEAIREPMEHLNHNVDVIVEYIALLGGCIVRPLYANGKLQYEAVPLGHYLPFRYDFDGTLTGAIILKKIIDGEKHFILTETHDFDGTNHFVRCKLYRQESSVLREVTLQSCNQTQDLTPEYVWKNCQRPMIVEFRNRAINKIDGSRVPVAMIAGVENIIEKADKQFERMDWEQRGGEKRIFADRDMFAKRRGFYDNKDGDVHAEVTPITGDLNRLIVKVDGDGSANGEKIHEYSPELRTAQQNEYLQQIFRRIELSINIGKGSISDLESVQQTATQYSGGRQDLYAIVDKIEDEITVKYQKCADVFAYMAAAWNLGPDDSEIVIKWNDDETRKDITAAKQVAMQEISAGVKNKWEYRKEFYGEDEATAKANTPTEPVYDNPFSLGA